ncbi:MAG TPA: hypothetical protein VFX12_15715 [Vicinamibacterales bacterium]|nr:hypothetical protein [Vicinamibacterales bacterium]
MTRFVYGAGAAVAVAVALAATPLTAQTKQDLPEHFTAFAVNISSAAPRAAATTVDIVINRWSPDATRDELLSIFKQKGQDALLTALQKQPVVGYINTPGTLRYDLHYARQVAQPDGGRKVVLATDRPISYWEVTNAARTLNYPFTLIQLQLDKDDHGVGKLSIATRLVSADDGVIELEDFADQPVRLNDVRKAG